MNINLNWCINYYNKIDCVGDKDEDCILLI